MWYWLRRSTHEPYVRWLYLASVICFFHLGILLVFFFTYRDTISHLTFTITRDYMRRRDIEFRVAIETIKKSSPAQTAIPAPPKKVPQAQKQAIVAQPIQKKEPPKKKISPKEKKVEPKKEVPAVVPVPVAPPKAALPPQAAPVQQEHLAMEITHDMKGFEHGIKEYEALYHDIVSCWSPPPGIPIDATCTITITIDRQGLITAMAMDVSSGMLVYDLAAQAAVNELRFPRLAWGKSITITFSV